MISSFRDNATRDIFDGKRSKIALKKLPPNLWEVAQRKLHVINAAIDIEDLRIPPGNHLEKLKGNLRDIHIVFQKLEFCVLGLPAWRRAGDRGQLRQVPKIEALARLAKAVKKNQFLECDVYTFSIRINKQYRIIFRWLDENAEQVEIVDHH